MARKNQKHTHTLVTLEEMAVPVIILATLEETTAPVISCYLNLERGRTHQFIKEKIELLERLMVAGGHTHPLETCFACHSKGEEQCHN